MFSIVLVVGKQRVPIMSAMLMGLGVRQDAVERVQLGRHSWMFPVLCWPLSASWQSAAARCRLLESAEFVEFGGELIQGNQSSVVFDTVDGQNLAQVFVLSKYSARSTLSRYPLHV